MAKNNVKAAPEVEQITKTEAFFEKNKKALIGGLAAIVVIIAGIILFNNYYLAPRAD